MDHLNLFLHRTAYSDVSRYTNECLHADVWHVLVVCAPRCFMASSIVSTGTRSKAFLTSNEMPPTMVGIHRTCQPRAQVLCPWSSIQLPVAVYIPTLAHVPIPLATEAQYQTDEACWIPEVVAACLSSGARSPTHLRTVVCPYVADLASHWAIHALLQAALVVPCHAQHCHRKLDALGDTWALHLQACGPPWQLCE